MIISGMVRMQSLIQYLRINPSRIYYLKNILEGYDNMALLTTINRKTGLILIRYIPSFQVDLFELLASLAQFLSTTREKDIPPPSSVAEAL